MAPQYTVNLVDTTGEEETILRTNSYSNRETALNALTTLAGFACFEDGERIEIEGESGETLTRTPHYWTPQEGDVVLDPKAPNWNDTGHVRVTEVTDTPADEYVIDDENMPWEEGTTVANENPDEPEDAPVVLGRYQRENGTESDEYALPASRLQVR